MAVDGLLSAALGLDDPLGGGEAPLDPTERTERYWSSTHRPPTRAVREPWRAQSHELIRTASFAGRNVAEASVSYGAFALPLQDAALDRAFECWVHGGDIADAVDYPYEAPSAAHLHRMIDLAARLLPAAIAGRRRSGLAGPAKDLVTAGAPGRSVHLEIEGHGGGDWYIALDSSAALGSPERAVAQVALDGVEFSPARRGSHLAGGSGGGPGGRPRGHPRRAVRGGLAQCGCRACRETPDHGTALTRRSPYGGR